MAQERRQSAWERARSEDCPTPFLALNLAVLVDNIETVAHVVTGRGGHLVPHIKTHKCRHIAALQVAAGSTSATCATVAEADLAFDSGFTEVLMAYPPVPAWRAEAYARLTRRGAVTVSCWTPEHVAALVATGRHFDVYWEVDSGTHRVGTAPGAPTVDVVTSATFTPAVRFTGLMTFAGHAYRASDRDGLNRVRDEQDRALTDTRDALAAAGVGVADLSVGTTPLAEVDTATPSRFRYGTYVFNDATQVSLQTADLDRCALAVATSVIDVPDPRRLVIDAGSKALPADKATPRLSGYGIVLDHPELTLTALYEEHGLVESDEPHGLHPGDRLLIVPSHACTAVNLYSRYIVVDAQSVGTWEITARR